MAFIPLRILGVRDRVHERLRSENGLLNHGGQLQFHELCQRQFVLHQAGTA